MLPKASLSRASKRLFVALDGTDLHTSWEMTQTLSEHVGGIKLGKGFFTAFGPSGIEILAGLAPIFLDLKFHDIPHTVSLAVQALAPLRPMMITVHASGGTKMLQAACKAAHLLPHPPLVMAVTVLTSLNQQDLIEVGQTPPMVEQVTRLAHLAYNCGCDGVICAPHEIRLLREALGKELRIATPGVRPLWADRHDQSRVLTPGEAIAAGADWVIVGRPVTRAPDPLQAVGLIIAEIEASYADPY